MKTMLIPLLVVGLAAGAVVGESASSEDRPRVALDTTRGRIIVELYPRKTPETAANFLQYVEAGFYDGTIFHRVIPGFMIQGGGFTPEMQKKPTRAPIRNEADRGLANQRGTLAMARTAEPHSASAQFFINLADNPHLNHRGKDQQGWGYTAFGRVVEGMEVVDAIAGVPTENVGIHQNVPVAPVVIREARRLNSDPGNGETQKSN